MGELERQGLYIAGSGGHQYADFAPNPSGHLVRWSDAAARIRELEATIGRVEAQCEEWEGSLHELYEEDAALDIRRALATPTNTKGDKRC